MVFGQILKKKSCSGFTSEKRRIDALIGYIIIFTSEKDRVARSPLLLTDN